MGEKDDTKSAKAGKEVRLPAVGEVVKRVNGQKDEVAGPKDGRTRVDKVRPVTVDAETVEAVYEGIKAEMSVAGDTVLWGN